MTVKNIVAHLSEIQKNLKVPKDRTNSFGNYKYRNCEDIVEAVKKLLPDGVVLILNDEAVQVGDRYYIRATAKLDDSVDCVEATAFAREPLDKKGMDSAQITGAASSYARKYALNGLFAIDDTEDFDSDGHQKNNSHDKADKINLDLDKIEADLKKLFAANDAHKAAAYCRSLPNGASKLVWHRLDQMQQQWIKDALSTNAP